MGMVVYQLHFSLRQARLNHHSSLVHFIEAPDKSLCPAKHGRAYRDKVADKLSALSFFVTTVASFGTASCITLRQWFAWSLREQGSQLPQVQHEQPCHQMLQSAVSENDIVGAVDWASAYTVYSISFFKGLTPTFFFPSGDQMMKHVKFYQSQMRFRGHLSCKFLTLSCLLTKGRNYFNH